MPPWTLVAEPGTFEVFIGEHAEDERHKLSFELLP